MISKSSPFKVACAVVGIVLLIFYRDPVSAGVRDGIALCLQTVLPALFPMSVLSGFLCSHLTGRNLSALRPFEKLCRLPRGAGSIFLVGIIGGYPIGAQNIGAAFQGGKITRKDGERMLGFCNIAGPGFILGISSTLFSDSKIPWVLWGIQILSVIITGSALPERASQPAVTEQAPLTLQKALSRSISAMANVCGWVVLFRVSLALGSFLLPDIFRGLTGILLAGALELTNGCTALQGVSDETVRFILLTVFLSLGGLCVALQVSGASGPLGFGSYPLGKLLQTTFALELAVLALPWCFDAPFGGLQILALALLTGELLLGGLFSKKNVAFPGVILYNRENSLGKEP